jgi:hypothetical protein
MGGTCRSRANICVRVSKAGRTDRATSGLSLQLGRDKAAKQNDLSSGQGAKLRPFVLVLTLGETASDTTATWGLFRSRTLKVGARNPPFDRERNQRPAGSSWRRVLSTPGTVQSENGWTLTGGASPTPQGLLVRWFLGSLVALFACSAIYTALAVASLRGLVKAVPAQGAAEVLASTDTAGLRRSLVD